MIYENVRIAGFWDWLKPIGKVTSPITTAIAKTFLPDSWVDAAAVYDPTMKTKVVTPASLDAAGEKLLTQKPGFMEGLHASIFRPEFLMISGSIIGLMVLMQKKNQPYYQRKKR